MAEGVVKGSVAGRLARRAAQGCDARSRSLQRLVRRRLHWDEVQSPAEMPRYLRPSNSSR
jgi:hypothetical protein